VLVGYFTLNGLRIQVIFKMSLSSKICGQYTVRDAQAADAQEVAFVHLTAWKSHYQGIIAQPYLEIAYRF